MGGNITITENTVGLSISHPWFIQCRCFGGNSKGFLFSLPNQVTASNARSAQIEALEWF